MQPEELKHIIESALPTEHVAVTGDGRHFEATVVSAAFVGKGMLKQHRMVYDALGDRFQTQAVHALTLKTYTPEEWLQVKN
jgi:acid stress-induced BolA-like protein IbaG/YrbA